MLYAWHINKNIQQHCKGKFDTIEAWETFISTWQGIIQAKTKEEYEEKLLRFLTAYSDSQSDCIKYIKKTWLIPGQKEALV